MGVLFRELGVLYEACLQGRPAPLPELPVQYADYTVWQRERLAGPFLQRELGYWKDRFSTLPPPLRLPSGSRPNGGGAEAPGRVSFRLSAEVTRELNALSRQEGATLFMTLLAGFKALLARYTGQEDLVVGTPIAGRIRAELEGVVGFFTNMLALRSDLSGDPSFAELLGRVRETALGAYAHQELPFERLVEELQPARELGRNPIFQVMFAVQNAPRAPLELAGLTVGRLPVQRGTAKFDLALVVREDAGALRGVITYSTDLFEAGTIERLAQHYTELLAAIVREPAQRLSALPLLSAGEQHQVLVEWNATRRAYPRERGVHQLFELQAERSPEAPAIVAGPRQLTYRELDEAANRLAHHLRGLGVRSESLVALCLDRSVDLAVAMLGVLKAGGAYVPLDPAHPLDRTRRLLEEARAAVLITTAEWLPASLPHGVTAVVLDRDHATLAGESAAPPRCAVRPENLAYVMYTSGSTGTPKGVGVPHRAVVNLAFAVAQEYGLSSTDRVLQFGTPASDFSVEELFPTWFRGATVVVRPPGPASTGGELAGMLQDAGVSVLHLPTAFWRSWVADLRLSGAALPSSLRLVTLGGERPPPADVAVWRERARGRLRWFNTYGPTEATVEATLHEATAQGAGDLTEAELPMGRPIANVQVYVLDRHLRPVPVGVPGELYIGGAGLGRGYLGRPGFTAERFVPNPFGEPGSRLYRTGDRVRWRADGALEFAGRLDHQIKIRGFRVELGEIEAALADHPAVRQVVVVGREDGAGERRLVAYVVPAGAREDLVRQLAADLRQRLPEYLIPSDWVLLDALPTTPTGKVDRRALPAPAGEQPGAGPSFVAPRTPLERTIAEIWSTVLHRQPVSVEADFFALGGHSLLATQVVARLRSAVGIELPLRAIFEVPTVAGLAQRVETAQQAGSGSPAPPLRPRPRVPRGAV
jgi:amino acid adenylation domain-containing protein